jgi:peptidyl-prolyl cis-trans isomerase B (cyclophilin B)
MTAALLLATAMAGSASLTPLAELTRTSEALPARLSGFVGACELSLLDGGAVELARVKASAGEVDLAELFPQIQAINRERPALLRVQPIVDGAPSGASLLVIPLRNRDTIRTTRDLRPDGTTAYTRVIGWGDQLLDPSNEDHARLKESWAAADPQPLSGFRLMSDVDVVFDTTAGVIRFAMRHDEAPNTARNFVELAQKSFYNGTIVHRIVPADRNGMPFVIQGGDPTGSGDGGPGYDLPLEPSRLPHDFGVISMARNDWPDSAGSQWFVCLSREATARLDGQYCAFGYAVTGTDAILAIAGGEIADPATGRPKSPEAVKSAFTVPAPPWTPGKGRPDTRVDRSAATPPPVEADR